MLRPPAVDPDGATDPQRGQNDERAPALTSQKVPLASKLMADPSVTLEEVCEAVGVS